ncbi:MAG: ribosome biogenesis GTPase Der [Patescibacteria group bacterium]
MIKKNNLKKIIILGRTNVGKSTLFNRLTDEREALVSNIAGTTRDVRQGVSSWDMRQMLFLDTAGLDIKSEAEIDRSSVKKALLSEKEAHLILFVVDAHDGILPQDREFANLLKKLGKPIIVVANKVDTNRFLNNAYEFYNFGFETVIPVSSKTGAGTGDLLDEIVKKLKIRKRTSIIKPILKNEVKIAIIGKPNTGKSSLLNAIVGEEKAIVSPIPHTTRDSQDFTVEYEVEKPTNKKYNLTFIDTAGIIKKRKIQNYLQELSIEQSIKSLQKAHIAFLVIDASQPITAQDQSLGQAIVEENKSVIIVVNKWDIMADKNTYSDKNYTKYLFHFLPFLTWAPIIFISAKNHSRIDRLVETATTIYENSQKRFTEKELKDFLVHLIKKKAPPKEFGTRPPFMHRIVQRRTEPITFEIFTTDAKNIVYPYIRFMEKEMRRYFNLEGCGIKTTFTENE